MFLEFLHCWCHICSSRHLLKSLLPSVGLLITGGAVTGVSLAFEWEELFHLSLSLVAEFLIFYILSSYKSLGWLLETSFSRKWCYNSSWFHPCPPTLVHFSETTPITGSAFTTALGKIHKDLARVGGGLGLALGALGVPTDPVGKLGYSQRLLGIFSDEVLKQTPGTMFL